jgi:hypothetical protein
MSIFFLLLVLLSIGVVLIVNHGNKVITSEVTLILWPDWSQIFKPASMAPAGATEGKEPEAGQFSSNREWGITTSVGILFVCCFLIGVLFIFFFDLMIWMYYFFDIHKKKKIIRKLEKEVESLKAMLPQPNDDPARFSDEETRVMPVQHPA